MKSAHKAGRMRDMAYIGLFAAVLAICSWISIPTAIPFTLQTLGVFTALGLLGGRRGTLSVLVYILLGVIGAPVFSGFKGGIGNLFNPTGGYIVGFLLIALTYWIITHWWGDRWWGMPVGMGLGSLLCYAFGTIWFMLVYTHTTGSIGLATALGWCVLPFVIPDLIKMAIAIGICKKISAHIP